MGELNSIIHSQGSTSSTAPINSSSPYSSRITSTALGSISQTESTDRQPILNERVAKPPGSVLKLYKSNITDIKKIIALTKALQTAQRVHNQAKHDRALLLKKLEYPLEKETRNLPQKVVLLSEYDDSHLEVLTRINRMLGTNFTLEDLQKYSLIDGVCSAMVEDFRQSYYDIPRAPLNEIAARYEKGADANVCFSHAVLNTLISAYNESKLNKSIPKEDILSFLNKAQEKGHLKNLNLENVSLIFERGKAQLQETEFQTALFQHWYDKERQSIPLGNKTALDELNLAANALLVHYGKGLLSADPAQQFLLEGFIKDHFEQLKRGVLETYFGWVNTGFRSEIYSLFATTKEHLESVELPENQMLTVKFSSNPDNEHTFGILSSEGMTYIFDPNGGLINYAPLSLKEAIESHITLYTSESISDRNFNLVMR